MKILKNANSVGVWLSQGITFGVSAFEKVLREGLFGGVFNPLIGALVGVAPELRSFSSMVRMSLAIFYVHRKSLVLL